MARTTHGHHIPKTELDEGPYEDVASICGGVYNCGQCIEEARKTPKHGGKVVRLIDRVGSQRKEIGWVEIDEKGRIIGELVITDTDFSRNWMNPVGNFSIDSSEGS